MPDIFVTENKAVEEKTKSSVKPTETGKNFGEKGTSNFLGSYCYYPRNVHFSVQEPEEKIVLLLRKHPITNVGWILTGLVMAVAPIVLSKFPLLTFLPARFQLVGILVWYLLVVAYSFEKFLDWFFSVYIITDERVIDVDFVNLIYREITDASIDKIQDVTVKMGGVVRSIFNYGDILIQTAGEVPEIEFEAAPRPDNVSKVLRSLIVEEEKEKIEGRVR